MVTSLLKLFKPKAGKNSSSINDEKLERARSLDQQRQFADAAAICRELLEIQPDHFDSLILWAEIAAKKGDPEQAIELYARIIDLKPEFAPAYYKRGNLLKDSGQMEEALSDYDRAIALDPAYAAAFCNRGVVMERLNRLDEACDSYSRAIILNPNDALAYYNRGSVLRSLKQPEEALASYNRAIAVKPDFAEAHCNSGILFMELKQWDAALASINRGIEIEPRFFQAYYNRGVLLQRRKQSDEALASYADAIEINPRYAEAYCSRGVLLTELGQWDTALESLDRAVTLEPGFAEAYCNRGNLYAELSRHEAALADFDKAIALKSDYADAFYNRANSLVHMKQFAAAITSYDQAFALKPDMDFLLGMRRHAKMNICDWNDLESDVRGLTAGIEAGESVSPPFPILGLLDLEPLNRRAAEIWVREKHPMNPVLPAIPKHPARNKIRIGYFSADFYDHPVAVLMAELFETHDRSKHDVTAFSFGPHFQGGMRKRLEKAFDLFVDVRAKSNKEISLLARSLSIDIAVDLGGFTGNSRTGIFAMRAAPIQINYLGYPGTMGADYMDYLIGDRTVVPEEHQGHYTEKIVYLPNCYLPNDSARTIADTVFTREELGLPPTGFVFCCFNNNYKITPSTFESWMRILSRVESSVLWLSQNNPTAASNLRREASRRGINPERLIFASRMSSLPEHLARHRAAGLFLDTRPYNAHATAIDALWAGLPVLTCIGEAFACRVAASLLKSIGLPELIAPTTERYEDLAVRLAANPQSLAEIKRKLADNRLRAPLFDSASFTKDLETAYRMIHERYQAALPPDHIYVAPAGC
jgi:predicted O-linked N-acetylglucosamine transferase (SPINDLY family)